MSDINQYNDLSESELENVIINANKALEQLKSKKVKEISAEIRRLADSIDHDVILTERQQKTSTIKGKKVPPKYRNPADPSQTWTGRGLAPVWMQELKDAGHDQSEFLID
jgi:DNA-binding protein H-NS